MFKELEFETLPVCRVGSRFPFVLKISEDEIRDLIKNSRMSDLIMVKTIKDHGVRCLFIHEDGEGHIGTYNTMSEELYTGSREVFCQQKD